MIKSAMSWIALQLQLKLSFIYNRVSTGFVRLSAGNLSQNLKWRARSRKNVKNVSFDNLLSKCNSMSFLSENLYEEFFSCVLEIVEECSLSFQNDIF